MIVEGIISAVTSALCGLLNLLPDISSDFIKTWVYIRDILIDIFTGIGCIIPVGVLFPLLFANLSLHAFRLIWAIILRLKSFIPFIGGG